VGPDRTRTGLGPVVPTESIVRSRRPPPVRRPAVRGGRRLEVAGHGVAFPAARRPRAGRAGGGDCAGRGAARSGAARNFSAGPMGRRGRRLGWLAAQKRDGCIKVFEKL